MLFITIFITLLSIITAALYFYYNQSTRLIKKIPGPKSWPIIGNFFWAMLPPDKQFSFFQSLSKQYGDVNQLHALNIRLVNISSPDAVEKVLSSSQYNFKEYPYTYLHKWLGDGLLLSNGNKWHQRRKMLTKAFHFNILKKFAMTFIEVTDVFLKELQNNEVTKEKSNVMPLISNATLRIMCETAMGISMREDAEAKLGPYLKSIKILGDCFIKRFTRSWLHLDQLFQLSDVAKTQNVAITELHSFTRKVIKNRRVYLADNLNQFDEDTEGYDGAKKLAMLDLLLKNEKTGAIDTEGIREEVDTFMFEGHDTTAVALSFMIMALANEPEIQKKIYEEMCGIFGDSDRLPTVEDLNEMKYLECCIKESLRLYPSAPTIARHLTQEIVLGGYTVPANTTCIIFIYDMHRRADLFPEPERFIPERFLSEPSKQRHPYSYVPFSAGARNCIGQKFALLEMKVVISGLLRKFHLDPVTKPSELVFKTDMILRTSNPIYVKFRSRK